MVQSAGGDHGDDQRDWFVGVARPLGCHHRRLAVDRYCDPVEQVPAVSHGMLDRLGMRRISGASPITDRNGYKTANVNNRQPRQLSD